MIPARLAAYYGASFLTIGVLLPFWPIWLENRGLDAEIIGLILGAGTAAKIIANPLIANFADRSGERKRLIAWLTTLALAAFLLFPLVSGWMFILGVNVLFFALWSTCMPLTESLTMQAGRRLGFDYGRVRLWGSLTFIVSATGIGALLTDRNPDLIHTVVVACLVLTLVTAWALPDLRSDGTTSDRFTLLPVLRDWRFVVFLVGIGFIQASHAVYYGFGTLNWRRAGLSEDIIGWLWAVGVIAEIVLFLFSGAVVRKIGPARLIAFAGLAGLVRWFFTASTVSLAPLFLLQTLHAFTFGAAHLGAMHFIASRVPPGLSATAQSVYSALVMGLVMGIALFASGHIFNAVGSQAYIAMAGMSAAGGAIVYLLRRRQRN